MAMGRRLGYAAFMSAPFIIIGFGSIGRRHLAVLRQECPDVPVIVVRRDGRPLPDDVHDQAEVVGSLDKALAMQPQAAVICSPAPFHMSQALACVEAKVPVLVEKPIGIRLADVDDLLAAARRVGVVVQVGYCLRFDPSLWAAQQAVAEGRIGRLLAVEAEVGQDLRSWRPGTDWQASVSARADLGGGALFELSHEIDYVRWLVGEVNAVTARVISTGLLEGTAVDDWVDLLLECRGGVAARVHMDMVQQPARRLCRMIGAAGHVEWDGLEHSARLYERETDRWTTLISIPVERNQLFRDQWRHFQASIASGMPPLVNGMDGRRVLEIVLAARQSSQEGRKVSL